MKKRQKRGFTLVELVVVLAILAIMAGIAIPTVSNWIGVSQEAADQSTEQILLNMLKTTENECANGSFPGTPYGKAHPDILKTDGYGQYYPVDLKELMKLNFNLEPEVLVPKHIPAGLAVPQNRHRYMYCYVDQQRVVRIDANHYPPTTNAPTPNISKFYIFGQNEWIDHPMLFTDDHYSFGQSLRFYLDGRSIGERQRPW